MKEHMDNILKMAYSRNASDIHITSGKPPMIREKGEMVALENYPALTAEHTKKLIYSIISESQQKDFEKNLELDCSYYIRDLCRFRVNVMMQKECTEAVLRIIPSKIPQAKDIGLSDAILSFSKLPRGLVLVTGPTGSGKSTTLAALIEVINQTRKDHIVTVEDPIEFVYEGKNCVIRQREVGSDTHTFLNALKHVLRQDPDIILVGEMRDLETISLAITAAETGHLVFATLHTQDAAQTIDRVIDVFPSHQQQQVRVQLASTLEGVVCQQLLPKADGKGRVAAREVMVVTPAISNLIREGKTHQIYSAIETGAKFGMVSMDSTLLELVKQRLITVDVALSKSSNPESLRGRINALGMVGAGPSAGPRPVPPGPAQMGRKI
ncbi:MAG: type IV pilus twitching motility protein PilT [Thermodesulfovibrionales bacterium]|nr:type IV pilus twitching motility protein PilT [Thermodesulfovibrionales bacterium]MDP3110899.1 type IV pilus twitching motility protein PilT [Thermodesulfovibrionales bacterium]